MALTSARFKLFRRSRHGRTLSILRLKKLSGYDLFKHALSGRCRIEISSPHARPTANIGACFMSYVELGASAKRNSFVSRALVERERAH